MSSKWNRFRCFELCLRYSKCDYLFCYEWFSGFILHLTSRHQLPARLAKRAMTGSGRTFSSFAPMDRVIDVWMTSEATFYYLVWVIQCFFPSLIHRFSVSRSRPGFEISNRMVICCVPVTVSDLSDCSQPLCAHAKQKASARSGR